MTTVTMTVTTDGVEDGLRIRLSSDTDQSTVETVLRDTPHGLEQRTTTTTVEGREKVLVDKVDRAAAPLVTLRDALQYAYVPLSILAQSMLNLVRYNRLRREYRPINMQTMCMCGLHTGDEYANVEFRGGIVGVPEHTPEPNIEPVGEPIPDDLLRKLWGEDGAKDKDSEGEGAA